MPRLILAGSLLVILVAVWTVEARPRRESPPAQRIVRVPENSPAPRLGQLPADHPIADSPQPADTPAPPAARPSRPTRTREPDSAVNEIRRDRLRRVIERRPEVFKVTPPRPTVVRTLPRTSPQVVERSPNIDRQATSITRDRRVNTWNCPTVRFDRDDRRYAPAYIYGYRGPSSFYPVRYRWYAVPWYGSGWSYNSYSITSYEWWAGDTGNHYQRLLWTSSAPGWGYGYGYPYYYARPYRCNPWWGYTGYTYRSALIGPACDSSFFGINLSFNF